jgi:hypothetical protein
MDDHWDEKTAYLVRSHVRQIVQAIYPNPEHEKDRKMMFADLVNQALCWPFVPRGSH